jgi:hypothetical protein
MEVDSPQKTYVITQEQIDAITCPCATPATTSIILGEVLKHEVVILDHDATSAKIASDALAYCHQIFYKIRHHTAENNCPSCWLYEIGGRGNFCTRVCIPFLGVGPCDTVGCVAVHAMLALDSAHGDILSARQVK